MRRVLTVLLLLAIVGGIAWWLWSWRTTKAPPPDPWALVPADAAAVLEVPTPLTAWARLVGTSQFWGELETTPPFGGIDAVVQRISLANPALEGGEPPLLVIWVPLGADSLRAVLAWPMEASPDALRAIGTVLNAQLPPSLWAGEILPVQPDSLLPPLFMAWHRRVLLLSRHRAMVAEAMHRAEAALPHETLFNKARASFSEGADAHLLLRPENASRLVGPEDNPLFPQGADVRGWMALDLRLRPDAVLMSGLLFSASDQPGLIALAQQKAAKPDIIRALPATACRMLALQVNNPATFVSGLWGKAPDPDLFAAYAAWVYGTIGTAEDTWPADSTPTRWAVFTAGDPGKAMAAMRARCQDGACAETEYRGAKFLRLPDKGALPVLFGPMFKAFEQPYWVLLGDVVVMSNTPAGMRAAVDAWTDRNSLALDPRSGDFFRRFGSEAAYSWWVDVAKASTAKVDGLSMVRNAMGGALFQLSPRADGSWTATFCLQHIQPEANAAAGALWTTALAAPPEGAVMLVKDYLSKTLQVLVQDREHRISLISCTGKILWQYTLDGPLMGGVQQVDRFRNGKMQLLLNTARKIYLIDRLGRDVEGFPVALKDSACTPLSVFDYDGRKDYRMVIPTAKGELLNFTMDGKPVAGWLPAKLPAPAFAPVEFARIKGKDFLVLPLHNGEVAVLDRRGEARYGTTLRMRHMANILGQQDAMAIGDRRILWTDSAGAVLAGSLDGKVDTLSQPASGTVAVFDLDGDGHVDVCRTTATTLGVEAAGKARLRVTFPDAPSAAAFPVPIPGQGIAVGLVLPSLNQVRLVDRNGDLWPGFPMQGAVPFQVADINLDGVPEVVTVDKDGIVSAHPLTPGR